MSIPGLRHRARQGFSLVELLMVIAISAIVITEIVIVLVSQAQITSTQNRNMINQQDMRDTLQFMADEIQLMGSGIIEPYVHSADTGEFTFVGDLDGNDDPDMVTYQVASGNLTRTFFVSTDDGATWTQLGQDVLLNDVAAMAFTYYAPGNTAPGTVDAISSVEIKLSLDTTVDDTAVTGGKLAAQSMVQRVTIRNRLIT